MGFLDGEYRSAREELLEARSVVESTREEKYDLLRAKQKAEQRCRVQEDGIKTLHRTLGRLQEELALEKVRAGELESTCDVVGKGNALKTFNGTQPYMAPEMFTNRPYTAATDPWALGMVVARYLSRGRPGA